MLFGLVALSIFALATIIPALLVVWVGERVTLNLSPDKSIRSLVLFLLFATLAILLIFSIYGHSFPSGDFPISILVLFPTLMGLIALLFVRWRDVLAGWRMNSWLVSVLLLANLVLLTSLGRSRELYYVPLIVLLVAGLTASIWGFSRRSSQKILELGGVLVAAFLFLDAAGVIDSPTVMSSIGLRGFYSVIKPLFFALALLLLAALILRITWGMKNGEEIWANPGLTVTMILLIAIFAVLVRKAVLVDATGRAAEDHIPFMEILFAILTGMLMVGTSRGRARIAGTAYIILVPVLIIGAYILGWLFEPQVITQDRAQRIAQAVEKYHQQNGVYPSNLEALTPQYMPYILGPLTGRGQVWCYQGEAEAYRLGYVYFQRYYHNTFPEPYFEIRTYATAGDQFIGPWICDDELEKYKRAPGL
jgi:hypothetical protein